MSRPPQAPPTQPRGGTGASRLGLVRTAHRRPARARLSISGSSGSGKTWTALSVAFDLMPNPRVLLIDTEFESAELYADSFPPFKHLPWEPPFDPTDLAFTIRDAGQHFDVIIIDSASHFWTGEGGTLEKADSKFSGWKVAAPAQNAMVESMLRSPAHVIMCTRAKQEYLVEEGADGRQKVKKLGLAPVQRNDLEYEMTVCLLMGMDHTIDIVKTRCSALSGRTFPANKQHEFAEVFADWLRGGEELATQADVDALRDQIRSIEDPARRKAIGEALAAKFGRADQLTASQMPEVLAFMAEQLAAAPAPDPASPGPDEPPPDQPDGEPAAEAPAGEPTADAPTGDGPAEPLDATPAEVPASPLPSAAVQAAMDDPENCTHPEEAAIIVETDTGRSYVTCGACGVSLGAAKATTQDPEVEPPPPPPPPPPTPAKEAAPVQPTLDAAPRAKRSPAAAAKAALAAAPARRLAVVVAAVEQAGAAIGDDAERLMLKALADRGLWPPRDLNDEEAAQFDEVLADATRS